MGLFSNLPAPTKRPADGNGEGEATRAKAARTGPAAAPPAPSAADLEDLNEGEDQGAGGDAEQGYQPSRAESDMEEEEEAPPPPPPAAEPTTAGAGGADDQVAAALRKISSHIGSPKKFAKASQLLRELLAQGAVRQAHGPLLFSALKAAMGDPAQCGDPLLAREYSKLFTAASKAAELFTTREKTQLDVYGTWAVLRNQLATDDSFQFNKVVTQLKAMVGELPEAEEAAEGVVAGLAAAAGAPDPVLQAYDARQQGGQQAQQQQQQQQAQQQAATSAEEAEADPFGLDALIEQQEEEERRAREAAAAARAQVGPKSATWSAAEVVSQRRAALLDCLDAAKACYRHAWARTSVDLLIEHCHQHTHRFAPSQAERLSELMSFVRDQRRLRKLGPSAREVNRDSTSFERASADWSRATVSHRGKVGGGDHKSEAWLG